MCARGLGLIGQKEVLESLCAIFHNFIKMAEPKLNSSAPFDGGGFAQHLFQPLDGIRSFSGPVQQDGLAYPRRNITGVNGQGFANVDFCLIQVINAINKFTDAFCCSALHSDRPN